MSISFNEAANEFVTLTHSWYGAARAYLPTIEIPNCQKCANGISHDHAPVAFVTDAQLVEAISLYREDQFLASINA